MKKTILILIACVAMGCERYKSATEQINDLPRPCIVRSVGISAFDGSINVQCHDRKYYNLYGGELESYKVNDTIH